MRERERESVCVCVCVSVRERESICYNDNDDDVNHCSDRVVFRGSAERVANYTSLRADR